MAKAKEKTTDCPPVEENISTSESQKTEEEKKAERAHYLKMLEKYYDRSKDKKEHAVKQFDALVVGISTAGVGFVTLYIKDMHADLWLARISQLLFVVCLFANLASHLFSQHVNGIVEKIALIDLDAEAYGRYPEGVTEEKFHDFQDEKCREKEKLDNLVIWFNRIALGLLVLAVIAFIIFAIAFPPVPQPIS